MSNATMTLIVLGVVAFFFVTELLPLAVTAMAGAIAVGVLGIIPMKMVFSGLSNSTVVLFAAMFVIGAAMFHTGLAQKVGGAVVKLTGTGENSLMFGTLFVAAALSSVTSNTATTACLIPVVIGICQVGDVSRNRRIFRAYAQNPKMRFGVHLPSWAPCLSTQSNVCFQKGENCRTGGYR